MNNPFDVLEEKLCKIEALLLELKEANLIPKRPPDELEDLIIHEKAAKMLGISPFTLYTYSSRGDIKFLRRGKRNFYSRKVLAEWVERGKK